MRIVKSNFVFMEVLRSKDSRKQGLQQEIRFVERRLKIDFRNLFFEEIRMKCEFSKQLRENKNNGER